MLYGVHMLKITSFQNPKVKFVKDLMNRSTREETKLFLIEGYRELKRAVEAGRKMQTLFFCPSFFLKENEWDLIEKVKLGGAEIVECAPFVFEKLSYRDRPDGLLAIAPQERLSLIDFGNKLPACPLLVIAESIEKPGNLGTILRSSDAAGVDGVIVCDPRTDVHNPNVVRASTGTLFTLPVIEATKQETFSFLKEKKIALLASSPHAKENFFEANLKGPIALLVGCEQYGLSQEWFDSADLKVRIPMHGVADSLNVAQATTLILYEAVRQRRYG
jgi:RNA methyltransferase, TrmH family